MANHNDEGVTSPTGRRMFVNRAALWAAGLTLLSGLVSETAWSATGKGSKADVINVVTFTVPAAGMARFLALCKANSWASLKKEPGVIGFDVMRPEGAPNTVVLIERYRDEAAYKSHRVTPHFLAFVKGAQEVGAQRTAQKGPRYYPS
jgi:quinol monooxygenase YgiN